MNTTRNSNEGVLNFTGIITFKERPNCNYYTEWTTLIIIKSWV